MIPPPDPPDEAARLEKLARLEILDTPPEGPFNNIAQLAAHVCGTPMALVTLIDDHRQWFKAKVGVVASETPRAHSFCGHALQSVQPMVIPDALADPRFHDNPLVQNDPNIRFYAGVPLRVGDGAALGTLCVIDRVPRQLDGRQLAALRLLADQVTQELQLRTELRRRQSVERAATLRAGAAPTTPAAVEDPPVSVGVRLDERYQIEAPLGQGGMGYVFAARDLRQGRPVAIKFLRGEPAHEGEGLLRFAREARAVMRLKSDHVAHIHDVGNTDEGVPYIVMERLEGEELGAALDRRGHLDPGEAAALILQACDVLGEAHAEGIVHRDIKPANLFMVPRPEGPPLLKVLDFGIARFAPHATGDDQPVSATGAATVIGSPNYMAPEQLAAEADLDGRVDIWALGVVLHEMLTGAQPFWGESLSVLYDAILSKPTPPLELPAGVDPALAPALGAIIQRCTRKRRAQRYASVWELARDLAPLSGR